MSPPTPKSLRTIREDMNQIYSVPNNEKNRRITMKEQEDLDHLLKEMIEELETNPRSNNMTYGSMRRPFNHHLLNTSSPLNSPATADRTGHQLQSERQQTPPALPNKTVIAGRSLSSGHRQDSPVYNTINRSPGAQVVPDNNNDASFQRNGYKTRSFSHSPAPKAKPVILYTANPYMPLASPKSSRSTPVSIEEVYASPASAGGTMHRLVHQQQLPQPTRLVVTSGRSVGVPRSNFTPSSPSSASHHQHQHHPVFSSTPHPHAHHPQAYEQTPTTGPPTPARNHQALQQHQHILSSPSSPTNDRASRGVSRSITLTPTPLSPNSVKSSGHQHHPLQQQQRSLSSPSKSMAINNNNTSPYTPASLLGVNVKTTRIVPGAKIGDQDGQNRTGVYASAYGKEKPLTRDERQELDDLINGMMEEIKHFPDYSSVHRRPGPQRSQSYSTPRTAGPVIETVSYHPGSGGSGSRGHEGCL